MTTVEGMNLIVINQECIENLIHKISELSNKVNLLTSIPNQQPFIYTNKAIKELLGIQDKLLKKYRDDGLLPYHQIGDKYWYTREDVENLLSNSYYEAYAYAS